jgi:hypothetical protein
MPVIEPWWKHPQETSLKSPGLHDEESRRGK